MAKGVMSGPIPDDLPFRVETKYPGFLIIGDTVVLILWPGKQTADKDIRGMQRHGGNHCFGQMDNSIGSVHPLATSVWPFYNCWEEKESGWTSMFYQGAICMSVWGLFTTICVLTSHPALSSTVTAVWAREAEPDKQVPPWYLWFSELSQYINMVL